MSIPVIIITLISLALIASGLILNEWTSGNKASLARKSARRHMRWRLILKKHENSNVIQEGRCIITKELETYWHHVNDVSNIHSTLKRFHFK